jgi:hypothetical protein
MIIIILQPQVNVKSSWIEDQKNTVNKYKNSNKKMYDSTK